MNRSIYIGYDPRESEAFAVCRQSLRRNAPATPIHALVLDELQAVGLYNRPTSRKDGRLWDDISEAPMSTEFAISRFLVPTLAKTKWALFLDCDIMARTELSDLFGQADPTKAVMCVKHHHEPPEGVKMDGQLQTLYARKNWSSVMLFNTEHPANRGLTVGLINEVPGRDLHRFCWLQDDDIGELHPKWNYLVGHTRMGWGVEPALIHWTAGGPWLPEYKDAPFASEYFAERYCWLNNTELQPIPKVRKAVANGVGAHA